MRGVGQEVQCPSGDGATTGSLSGGHSDVQPVLGREVSPERALALAALDLDPLCQADTASDGCADRRGLPQARQ